MNSLKELTESLYNGESSAAIADGPLRITIKEKADYYESCVYIYGVRVIKYYFASIAETQRAITLILIDIAKAAQEPMTITIE